ncbi:hypothetical protein Tco_0767204 [Tanacetum coccineum]
MVANQALEYAPQCSDLTVESVVFHSNNFVGNFNYPQSAPAYKQNYKFLMNCPLVEAFTKTPSELYQNFLRKFWCTAIAYDPDPPTDNSEARPLKEYKIKFIMMNGKKPLTLDFKTFVESTGLDYNQGTYVSHPSPEAVKVELAKITTEEVLINRTPVLKMAFSVAWRILFTFVIQTRVNIWEIIYSDLVTRLTSKSRKKYVSYLRFVSCALAELLGAEYTQDEKFESLSNVLKKERELSDCVSTKTKDTGPEASGSLPQKRKKALTKKTTPQATKTLPNEEVPTYDSNKTQPGTRKSQPLPEVKTTNPKDSGGDNLLADKGLPYTVFDEGTGKTTPLSKGPREDKDSERLKPLADIESQTSHVTALSGVDAKDQVDQTQSIGFEKPESSIAKKIDVSDSESLSCFESLKPYENYMLITERQLHEEVVASYADLKWGLEDFINTSFTKYENTDIALRNYEQLLNLFKTNHNTSMRRILENLKEVQDAVKEDPVLNKKVLEAAEAYTKKSTNLTELLTLVKSFDYSGLKSLVESLKAIVDAQNDTWPYGLNTSKIKSSNCWGDNFAQTATQEPYSHTKGEKANMETKETVEKKQPKERKVTNAKEPVQEPQHTRQIPITIFRPITRPDSELEMIGSSSRVQLTDTTLAFPIPQPTDPVIDITPLEQPESPPVAPKADRGKGKVLDDVESTKKLLTNDEIQEHLDKEEKIKKAIKEVKLLAISKPELIKVVHEEGSRARIDLKIIESAKGGQQFKKIQDAEIKVLNREHGEKIKRFRELRKKRIEKYQWTTSSILKPKTITDVKIHPNSKPVAMTAFRGTDKRNFDVHNPFNFGDFGMTEWDELREIIPKKKNLVVKDLMNSLSKSYERLETIPDELGIRSTILASSQVLSITLGRNKKHMELEHEIRIPGFECNRSLPEGVPYINYMVIEEPEYEMFFIDVFGYEVLNRMNDMHKVDIETLLTYLVMASNITTPKNTRFYLKLRNLNENHPGQDKLKSKKVKLESVRYKLD